MFENIYIELLEKLNAGIEVALISLMKKSDSRSGKIEAKYLVSAEDLSFGKVPEALESILPEIQAAFDSGLPKALDIDNELVLIEPYFPKPRLIIFGGGHIAKPLSELGTNSEFAVTIVDDRPQFANIGRFPEAETVICDSFENAFLRLKLRKSDFVVVVTRGHVHDGICIRKALEHELAYLGMIGSKRRVAGVMAELKAEGFDAKKLERINSPIGLEIGAVTPYEIAISIIAQIIAYRRLKTGGRASQNNKNFNWPEFDRDVLEQIQFNDPNRALVTIISSKGSVPRKAGAKMLVYLDGIILGSIGGGCSEAGIIGTARDMIREKGYRIEEVDMTGDVAESLGMVCGGIMDVIIESF